MAGSLIAIAYGGVLHYFGLETGMRPVLKDINRQHAPWANSDIQVLSLRVKLMASLPLINVIAGLTAAALSGGGGGGASLGADVLIAIGVAVAVSLVLTFLLASSVLRPASSWVTWRSTSCDQIMVKCGGAILLAAGRFSQI